MMFSEPIAKLIASIRALPGITKKQAEKLAYHLLGAYKDEASTFVTTYQTTKAAITSCVECGNLDTSRRCAICQNKRGDRRNMLIIVESPLDIIKFERSATINGYYHVLNGLIDINNDQSSDHLNVANLPRRASKFSEIILALSSNMEGIVTANYIKSLLGNHKITQLAQGIPIGSAIEYVDQFTLKTALKNRKELK